MGKIANDNLPYIAPLLQVILKGSKSYFFAENFWQELIKVKVFSFDRSEDIQWRPIQMRIFHSNESCLLAPILSLLPLFWWKERGIKGSSHLNENLSFEQDTTVCGRLLFSQEAEHSESRHVRLSECFSLTHWRVILS